MGKFIPDEKPVFRMKPYGNKGEIIFEYNIEGCVKFYYKAIERACDRHSISPSIVAIGNKYSDPWKRVKAIHDACIAQNANTKLNSTTMLDGFVDKVYPVIFEMVCLEAWEGITERPFNPNNKQASDAITSPDRNNKVRTIDWKAKTRNVSPIDEYDASILASQRYQNTELYCFGQTTEAFYYTGYILGIISKKDFWNPKGLIFHAAGTVDNNKVKYVKDTYARPIGELWRWKYTDNTDVFMNEYYIADANGRV